jgi:hypothetical protein
VNHHTVITVCHAHWMRLWYQYTHDDNLGEPIGIYESVFWCELQRIEVRFKIIVSISATTHLPSFR